MTEGTEPVSFEQTLSLSLSLSPPLSLSRALSFSLLNFSRLPGRFPGVGCEYKLPANFTLHRNRADLMRLYIVAASKPLYFSPAASRSEDNRWIAFLASKLAPITHRPSLVLPFHLKDTMSIVLVSEISSSFPPFPCRWPTQKQQCAVIKLGQCTFELRPYWVRGPVR